MGTSVSNPANAIEISGHNIRLLHCDVTDNQAHGIVIKSGTNIQIHDCNIERNGGVGVSNPTTAYAVDATRNWWGDPAGPFGPAGDGVSGAVLWLEPRTARIVH